MCDYEMEIWNCWKCGANVGSDSGLVSIIDQLIELANWMDTPDWILMLWICYLGIPLKRFFLFLFLFCFFFSLSNLQSLTTHMHLVYSSVYLPTNNYNNNNNHAPSALLHQQQRQRLATQLAATARSIIKIILDAC